METSISIFYPRLSLSPACLCRSRFGPTLSDFILGYTQPGHAWRRRRAAERSQLVQGFGGFLEGLAPEAGASGNIVFNTGGARELVGGHGKTVVAQASLACISTSLLYDLREASVDDRHPA